MDNQVANIEKKLTHSERFTQKVLAEFGNTAGEITVTEFQRRLIQNYFITIDSVLKATEVKRDANKNKLSATWENVNMNALSVDVVQFARLGLDSSQKNHVHFIPYKNNKTQKYDIGFITGYIGLEVISKKYALEMPTDVICELVYSNDIFKPIKRNLNNKYESYEFEIGNPFDRGEIIGGFAYFIYPNPEKNCLKIMTIKDILKRKPKYASPEFWGGEKDAWVDGKKVGKEKVEGWYEEMCLKTIKRYAYTSIALDPAKIDENFNYVKKREAEFAELEVQEEIDSHAGTEIIDVTPQNLEPKLEDDIYAEPDIEEEPEPVIEGGPTF